MGGKSESHLLQGVAGERKPPNLAASEATKRQLICNMEKVAALRASRAGKLIFIVDTRGKARVCKLVAELFWSPETTHLNECIGRILHNICN